MSVVAAEIPREPVSNQVAWKSFANLVDRFGFSAQEARTLIGGMPHSTYHKGLSQHNVNLNRDQLERISYLLGIYKALRILFVDSAQALSWINRANELPPFNGATPREFIMQGSILRLAEVRRFLDFWRGY